MIRVYLDWNIFSYLKQFKETKEPYISLNRNLLQNTGRILIPYSSAHLTDLVNGDNSTEKAKQEISTDLQYLEQLTSQHCIQYDYKNKKTYPEVYNIQDYYEQIKDSREYEKRSVDELFSFSNELADLNTSLVDIFKNLPTGVDFFKLNEMLKEWGVFQIIFDQTRKQDNYYNLLSDTRDLLYQYNNDPKVYTGLRNRSLKVLGINHDYTKDENPIETISNKLLRSPFKKSFNEFVEQILGVISKNEPSGFDIFTVNYLMLDYLGYYRDKKFRNLTQDSFHAYYGAHCDFFITDDENTYKKAKALYKYFNIETEVCKSTEFNSSFFGKVLLNSSVKLVDSITETIGSSFVAMNYHDDNFNPVDIYKLKHFIASYFNRLQVTHDIGGTKYLYLYKRTKNYSSFYFWKEIETIVNEIVKEFGVDNNSRSVYIRETENAEISNNQWKGRVWKGDKTEIELQMKESPFNLTLSFAINLYRNI
ncbi:MAG: hypothetical protein JNM41_07645 [Flavipsychrobacter sp.]|nr:hypothetical protein [Flavipsychrobacter sp.]